MRIGARAGCEGDGSRKVVAESGILSFEDRGDVVDIDACSQRADKAVPGLDGDRGEENDQEGGARAAAEDEGSIGEELCGGDADKKSGAAAETLGENEALEGSADAIERGDHLVLEAG